MAARFTNLDGTTPDKGPLDMLKWQVGDRLLGKRRRSGPPFTVPHRANDGALVREARASLTWVGHATFAMRLGGKLVVTDPVLGTRIQGVVKRLCPPGLRREVMGHVDVVTVSHDHFDHLDVPSLRHIGPEATFVTPLGCGKLLRDAGLPNVIELDRWQEADVHGLRVRLVPAQHWCMRAPWDRNTRLWGGFVIEGPEGKAYHAGDTAFAEDVFAAIGAREPGIDWAMMPIGAYDPEWFMSPQHIGPEDAVRAHRLLGAKHFVAMHWGTFRLTDEPIGEPPVRARAAWEAAGNPRDHLWISDLGETRVLTR